MNGDTLDPHSPFVGVNVVEADRSLYFGDYDAEDLNL